MSEETTTKVSLSDIPVLKNNATYAKWKKAVEHQLMIFGGSGIIDGTEEEPYRKAYLPRDRRAGSLLTTASETNDAQALTAEQTEEWRLWKKSELKVRGILLATVSEGMSDDLDDLKSAKEIWDKLKKKTSTRHTGSTIKNSRQPYHVEATGEPDGGTNGGPPE
jgi:hypothetical protein